MEYISDLKIEINKKIYVMSKKDYRHHEIDLRELFQVLYNSKTLIFSIVVIAVLISMSISLILPNIYKSEAILAHSSGSSGGSLAGSQALGGLASMAGINLGGLDDVSRKNLISIETLKSRKFFSDYLYDKVLVNLMATDYWDPSSKKLIIDPDIYDEKMGKWVEYQNNPARDKPSIQESYNEFSDLIDINEGEMKNGLVFISISHKSPDIAKEWVDLVVDSINEAMRKKDRNISLEAISYLVSNLENTKQIVLRDAFSILIEEQTKNMMLTNIADDYVFSVIEPPVASETRSSPKRTFIVVLGSFLGFFAAILFVLMRNYYFQNKY